MGWGYERIFKVFQFWRFCACFELDFKTNRPLNDAQLKIRRWGYKRNFFLILGLKSENALALITVGG